MADEIQLTERDNYNLPCLNNLLVLKENQTRIFKRINSDHG